MTKLTDIPGASEALPHSTRQLYGYDGRLNSGEKYIYIIERIYTVHLEVDVEAMAQEIRQYWIGTNIGESKLNSQQLYKPTALPSKMAKHLSITIPKWARLVRK